MEVSHDLSIPNLVISALVLTIAIIGKAAIFLALRWQWQEIKRLEKKLEEVAPAVVGELMLRREFKEWGERQSALEAKTELLERRLDAIDTNGNGSHAST
jgi:biopolymer transport protein ExbB/TolQ